MPPYSCTFFTTSSGARRLVMMIGTWWRMHTSRSWSRRSLDWWMIWLTAKGAILAPGCACLRCASAASIVVSHSSNICAGRALSAGNEPTTPLSHWAMTRFGLETMNMGAAITGSDSWLRSFWARDICTSLVSGNRAPCLLGPSRSSLLRQANSQD